MIGRDMQENKTSIKELSVTINKNAIYFNL